MRITYCLIAILAATAPLAAQDRFAGEWRGYWTQAGDTMAVTMHLQTDVATGRYKATFDAERLRVSGIPFADVQVDGTDVALTLRGDRTTTVFTGKLRGDSLSGVLREGATEGAFAFMRVKTASATFEEREVTFNNGDVKLAGNEKTALDSCAREGRTSTWRCVLRQSDNGVTLSRCSQPAPAELDT